MFVGGKGKAYTGERKAMGMANFLFKEQKSFVMSKLGGGGSGSSSSQGGQGSSGSSGEAVVELDESSFDSVVLESTEMWMVSTELKDDWARFHWLNRWNSMRRGVATAKPVSRVMVVI